ncbi:MAG TPA: OmpA family protein [Bryobacteraceae bacterium]|jgi:outer membrane protein OmpA-like peptidoglycan-associated protein|nr:OmpA family protein [Bryobacteraceae bacterium]
MKIAASRFSKVMVGALLTVTCGLMVAFGAGVISPGVKAEIKGRINKRTADTIVLRDANNIDTAVLLTDNTTIKSNKKGLGVFRRGKDYGATSLLRGLMVEADGTGNSDGQLVAKEIKFNEADLKDVMTVQSRVQPVEEEQQKISGKLDETTATANKANESAEDAHKRLDSVNDRITGLDDYAVQDTVNVYFPVNKYTLSDTDKKALDDLATKALAMKGYVLEVAGFADSTGDPDKNLELSQRRADAVVQYMAITHNIPPRRMVTPIGYGDTRSKSDTTSQAQALDRRVETKLLVSRGQTP